MVENIVYSVDQSFVRTNAEAIQYVWEADGSYSPVTDPAEVRAIQLLERAGLVSEVRHMKRAS